MVLNSLARRSRSPPASEGLIDRCEDLVLRSGSGGSLLRIVPCALEIPCPDVYVIAALDLRSLDDLRANAKDPSSR
jgi:hypothetical protein